MFRSNARCTHSPMKRYQNLGRHNVNDTNAPPDLQVAIKLNNVDGKEGYHPQASMIILIKFLGLLGD